MSLKKHLIISLIIRLLLIVYGEVQDQISEVPYTDVDYRVVTDGARRVYESKSPFNRHTYRYTPLLAIALLPNIYLHRCFGKILFVLFDLVIAILIKCIIMDEYHLLIGSQTNTIESNKAKLGKKFSSQSPGNPPTLLTKIKSTRLKFEKIGNFSAYVWLYNPLTMIIATRGNGDSITCSFVLISIYYLLKVQQRNKTDATTATSLQEDDTREKENEKCVIMSGLFHGLAIHFRLYPIFFSLAYYLYLSDHKNDTNSFLTVLKCIIKPNRKQVLLILSVLKVLIFTTGIFYLLYHYEFLYESIIYHFVRKDTRHNFSLFFYLQYLNSDHSISLVEKLLTITPQLVLIVLISFNFCRTRQTFQFALFLIAFIMVTYNPVITSQYFVWFLSLLPLAINNLRNLTFKRGILLPSIWFLGQGSWLMSAYFLEFRGFNTFDFIWLQSVIFFIINIIIVQILITDFDVYTINLK
ncbi:unnamed protein product [Diamesa serratosioi]